MEHDQPDAATDKKLTLAQYIDYYGLFREYVIQESNLIGTRLTWVITLNSFMFAAFDLSFPKRIDIYLSDRCSHVSLVTLIELDLFIIFIAVVASLVNYYGKVTIAAAQQASNRAHDLFLSLSNTSHEIKKTLGSMNLEHYATTDGYVIPGIRGGGDDENVRNGHDASKKIPLILSLVWAVVAVMTIGVFILDLSNGGIACEGI